MKTIEILCGNPNKFLYRYLKECGLGLTLMGDFGGDAKNLTAYSTSQNKKKVYVNEGCTVV